MGVGGGWLVGTALWTSKLPGTAGGRECRAPRGSGPGGPKCPRDARGAQDRMVRSELTELPRSQAETLMSPGAGWLGRRGNADSERLSF